MAVDMNLLQSHAAATKAEARAREFEKRMVSDTIVSELEAMHEGEIYKLVRLIILSAGVSSLAKGIENKLMGSGAFVPAWVRRIGAHACSTNGSTEYKGQQGSLQDLVEIDRELGVSSNLADAATSFWGGLHEVVKGRKLRRQLQALGGELLLASALVESIPDWATTQPLTGINAHFAKVLNSWLGLDLPVKELEYFGSQYNADDYMGLTYDGLISGEEPDVREGSVEHGLDQFTI